MDTKLFAEGAQGDGGKVVFETTKNFFSTPAKITGIYNIDPFKDRHSKDI